MQFRRKRRTQVDIGLIPMIDVLLVLLFFFMVATTFRHHSELKINLPEAQGSDATEQAKTINLYVDAKGTYALAGDDNQFHELVNQNLDGLKAALAQTAGESRLLPFIISADGKAPHQAVVSALDVANQLGFHHITFAINRPEK
ncbi:ExbD/TolR family protein [Methylomonas sp. BW4-1]|uniref:Biopolymer transporter ExbD n=1 Tax=Methylomonas defluvii TaxID=3045149 RepID=A0ABU4UJU5_9GAMM|nr:MULTISPECIES: biopolymer transporter ExbD [unclassified Methylomonas]MDX8129758.1 biopolymer transporter ExbD [Methylomonas sp. OY6]PKD40853.1 biopolymer transporter ExbD [Methylomonas sp. Kb3]QBC27466.1 biopolymer transporter ExbD [Methylomonas sp. LW13]QSB03499.1 biopolymer transporter ExbD [Methylomonas sp. EFPC1]